MVDPFENLINIPQLEVLGFKKEHFNMFLLFLLLYGIWLLVKVMTTFLIKRNYVFVLTYVISSLIIITIASVLSFTQWYSFHLAYIFHVAILFGLCLSIYLIYQHIKSKG